MVLRQTQQRFRWGSFASFSFLEKPIFRLIQLYETQIPRISGLHIFKYK